MTCPAACVTLDERLETFGAAEDSVLVVDGAVSEALCGSGERCLRISNDVGRPSMGNMLNTNMTIGSKDPSARQRRVGRSNTRCSMDSRRCNWLCLYLGGNLDARRCRKNTIARTTVAAAP